MSRHDGSLFDTGDSQVLDDGFLKIHGNGRRIVAKIAVGGTANDFAHSRRETKRICPQSAVDESFSGLFVDSAFSSGDIAPLGYIEDVSRQASSPHGGTSLDEIWVIIPLEEIQAT
jgi:hypothetical protein